MSALRKFIFKAGARYRNPSLFRIYRALKASESWTREQLESYAQTQLLSFLEHSGTHAPYYRELFATLGWKPGTQFTMELFRRIPVSDKRVLVQNNSRIHADAAFSKLFQCETSGTSGTMLTFRRNEEWDSFNRASILRGYSWHGVNPWDFNIYFWGFNFSFRKRMKVRFLDFLVNRKRLFGYSKKDVDALVKDLPKAVYIEGYASMIYELALLAAERQVSHPNLRLVKGTSEKIHPHYQQASLKAFGKPVTGEYGAAEAGIIAFGCAHGNMHLNLEGVFVETDENQEIILTNFRSLSFPVIRYKLGDTIRLADREFHCPCGLPHPVLEEVVGRTGSLVIGKTGKYPSMCFYNIFKNLYFTRNLVLNYQVFQGQPGMVEVRTRETIGHAERQWVLEEVAKYFGDDLEVQLKPGSDLRMQEGKLRDFITTLN